MEEVKEERTNVEKEMKKVRELKEGEKEEGEE